MSRRITPLAPVSQSSPLDLEFESITKENMRKGKREGKCWIGK